VTPIWWLMKDERRSEDRIRSKGRVTVMAGGQEQLAAEVYDICQSGISLLVQRAVDPGTRVQIDAGHLAAEGVVVHCAARGDQHCLGIAFDPPTAA
jgi:hypothetical protein